MRNVKNLALFVLMLALVSTAAVADIHYVNPCESIQAAIDAADPGDEVWVAPGFYTEAIDFNGKAIRLYSSGGPDVTIIDGTGHYHVVQCTSGEGPDTVLEGFTITGGNANGTGVDDSGGGMLNDNSSPSVTDCCFTGNYAGEDGGGMSNRNSNSTVANCTFMGNSTGDGGGGMHNGDESHPTVTDCTFKENLADDGGGIQNIFRSSPTIANCTFVGNSVAGSGSNNGGGIDNTYDSHAIITNCTFTENSATYGGAMLSGWGSSPVVANCLFVRNSSEYGGGMYNLENNPTIRNCTFSGNTASQGGGMYNSADSSPTVTNCILWADSPSEIVDSSSSSTTVTYSDVQGGTGETWFGEGCIDTNPMFADPDGRLSLGSPCIDAGNDAAVPPGVTTDLDGNPRIQGVCVDMGAFESDFIVIDFSGWVWMESGSDFGYSSDEDDLLYFLSFGPVWYYNTATSLWGEEGPVGWVYVNWPYLYELDTSTTMFALPPASGLWVYHFRPSQWTVSPQIIP